MPFPFSDLSGTKLRPAVVLADTGHNDWLLCQITSNAYRDSVSIRLTNADLKLGTLSAVSYVRPIKLFTANESLVIKRIAILKDESFKAIVTATIAELRKNIPS
jgi:mRNA interferase MazF